MAISKIDGPFFISSPIGLKFSTRLEGDNAHKFGSTNFNTCPLKMWRPFEFCDCIMAYETKNFKF